ncbi:MAG: pentapeptide repeat-containing protein, partial [candidate division Zixibacteria bacterium]|nr:pentapeptide repeat-containing protein [candidate division Zixibacteria bacterium]
MSTTLDLTGAKLSGVDLSKKALRGVVLCGANLDSANLSGSDLTNTIFDRDYGFSQVCEAKTTLEFADLSCCIFEPIGLPSIESISTAEGLRTLRWEGSNSSLVQLREELGKSGFRQQEREVICALRRHDPGFFDK